MTFNYCGINDHHFWTIQPCPLCAGKTPTPDYISYGWQASINKAITERGYFRDADQFADLVVDTREHLNRKRDQITAAAEVNGWNTPRQKRYIKITVERFLKDKQTRRQTQFEHGASQFDPETDVSSVSPDRRAGILLELGGTPPIWSAACDCIWSGLTVTETAAALKVKEAVIDRVLARVVGFIYKSAKLRAKKIWTPQDFAFYQRWVGRPTASSIEAFTGCSASVELLPNDSFLQLPQPAPWTLCKPVLPLATPTVWPKQRKLPFVDPVHAPTKSGECCTATWRYYRSHGAEFFTRLVSRLPVCRERGGTTFEAYAQYALWALEHEARPLSAEHWSNRAVTDEGSEILTAKDCKATKIGRDRYSWINLETALLLRPGRARVSSAKKLALTFPFQFSDADTVLYELSPKLTLQAFRRSGFRNVLKGSREERPTTEQPAWKCEHGTREFLCRAGCNPPKYVQPGSNDCSVDEARAWIADRMRKRAKREERALVAVTA